MRIIPLLLFFLCTAVPVFSESVPTPAMAIGFDIQKDGRQWERKTMEGNTKGFLCELVPLGDSIDAWHELVAQQIFFTNQSLKDYVTRWKNGILGVDPKAELKEQKNPDGSITINYRSDKGNEAGIRRFMKAFDGIYMLTYQVRPKSKDERIYKIWSGIIADASLTQNPYAQPPRGAAGSGGSEESNP